MGEYREAERGSYVAIAQPVPAHVAAQFGPELANGIRATSVREAAEKIGRNENIEFAFLELWSGSGYMQGQLESALASNKHLRDLYIHMCTQASYKDAITEVARGIMHNTSIKRVFWSVSRRDRTEETALVLREMMEKNSVMDSFYIKSECKCYLQGGESKTHSVEDAFTEIIFRGLEASNTIKTFRLTSNSIVSDKNKKTLLDVVEKNRFMQKVHVEFGEGGHQLQLFLVCNREKWMERLTDNGAPRQERVRVFLEAHECKSVEPVSTMYHLLRSCPELLLNDSS
jgi:hypothetical protein